MDGFESPFGAIVSSVPAYTEGGLTGWVELQSVPSGNTLGYVEVPSPLPSNPQNAWMAHLTLRPTADEDGVIEVASTAEHVVRKAGEEHQALVMATSRSGVAFPEGGLRVSLVRDGVEITSMSAGQQDVNLNYLSPVGIMYTTQPEDIGSTLSLRLRTSDSRHGGLFQLLVDDAMWTAWIP